MTTTMLPAGGVPAGRPAGAGSPSATSNGPIGAPTALIDALRLVAGGGGGAGADAGGTPGCAGGAGEHLEITTPFPILKGVTYRIHIGRAGRGGETTSAAGGFSENGENGEASFAFYWGVNGGGAAAGSFTPGGSGTSTQTGFDGGSGGGSYTTGGSSRKFNPESSGHSSTGPGGAGAGGPNGGGSAGGPGVTSSITGSPVTRAAGGQAGLGGDAAANTGNGGNGGAPGVDGGNGGDGGSGEGTIRYATSEGVLTVTGSYSVLFDGDRTVVIFTGPGTFRLD